MAPKFNALHRETSPYLLQHADNPVKWFPWCAEALQKAKQENKPILLSIGYSACHWCHVMAHESFEDTETAKLMNQHFINIKVDREERPDLDRIYQTAQYMLTQRTGGWPLTMFLNPEDQVPFFGGTYFPSESRYGLPGFKGLLQRVADYYQQNIDDIRKQNLSLITALKNMEMVQPSSTTSLNPQPLTDTCHQLQHTYDKRHGGFGAAPKFPHPTTLEFLLQYHVSDQHDDVTRSEALNMALETLKKMAMGGIYDHIGGGFARYSVDERWMIPHFEKMLYDNGPLLTLYSDAWQIHPEPLFEKTAQETADWVIREMQSPTGGYYSSLDADSEGEEGKFYVWDKEQIKELVDEQTFPVFADQYGLNEAANFEGHWHLYQVRDISETANHFDVSVDECRYLLDSARAKLLSERNTRIWPGRDEKILTSWNALMIKGMANAARTFMEPRYLDSAELALSCIQQTLWEDGALLATCKDGHAHLNAYLDDYAFLIDAILAVLQNRWNTRHLEFAIALADSLLDKFADPEQGGFYFTSHDHETLIQRNKPFTDESLPSGNGIAALSLLRLGHLLGDLRYLTAAEDTLKAAWSSIQQVPYAHTTLLIALAEYLNPGETLTIHGPESEISQWQQGLFDELGYRPNCLIFAIPENEKSLPGILAERVCEGPTTAYLCRGTTCLPPYFDLNKLLENLKTTETG